MQSKTIKILGVDPGTAIVGWGLIEKEGHKITAKKYGCIRTTPDHTDAARLKTIYDDFFAIIKEEKPDEIAIEQLFYFKNQKTIITVAQARGILIACAQNQDVPIFEYTPLQVKQALTGYGRADKKQMQEMVRLTCKLSACPTPDDAADALAVAICHSGASSALKNPSNPTTLQPNNTITKNK